ncbi:MAG: hypothetical protein IVW56_11970 [Candidatus Binataceae bacterium]|nr:hypothetical protein [Candidatus Binataceae bacterium]
MKYRLLEAFRHLFDGQRYLHRRSNLGDLVAMELFEDIYTLARSKRFVDRVDSGLSVMNVENRRVGVKARRGDGSFGELVPNAEARSDRGFAVRRGPIATIELGVEVKILFKAMIKQIDRVINDLQKQVVHFTSKRGRALCVGIVGVNFADHCTSYEGRRAFRTDGKKYQHPIHEAAEAESRLMSLAAPAFDEFLVLEFEAANERPYQFKWRDESAIKMNYGAILARLSQHYEERS